MSSAWRAVIATAVAAAVVSASANGALGRQGLLEQTWSQELAAAGEGKKSPVKRVVELLTKMKAELEAEAEKESEMYDKMVCWCKTTKTEKTAAIAKADATMKELESEIEGRAARFGELSTKIEAMKEQISEDTAALRQSTSIREGEAGEFRGEEKDLVQAITNLKNAIGILSKHHSSLLQLDAPTVSGMRVVLRDLALKHAMYSAKSARRTGHASFVAVSSDVKREQGATDDPTDRLLLSALQGTGAVPADEAALPLKFAERVLEKFSGTSAHGSSFLQASRAGLKQPLAESYSSRSSGIFGILKQMLEDFEGNLKSSQDSEKTAAADHAALAAAKTEQLSTGKEKLDEMETEKAENGKSLSDAKENLGLTSKQRSADVEFLRNLKLTCNDLDSQWEERSKTRSAETVAIAETLTILTEDENREQLTKGAASFLQLSSQGQLRARAAAVLRDAAASPAFGDLLTSWEQRPRKVQSAVATGPKAQLNALATMLQLDSFTKVKEMMDKLVADMKEEQEEEVKFKAYCQKEFSDNEKAVHKKTNEKKDHEAKIEELSTLIEKLTSEIKSAEDSIASTELGVKQASQTREAENAEFQTTVADQRAIQSILKKALARLEDFYKKDPRAQALLQRQAQSQTPPVQFNKYKTNAGASPVMGLLEQIIGDSKTLEKEATSGEYAAQGDYEKMVKDSNAIIADLKDAVAEKTKTIAGSKEEKTQTESGHASAVGELESLGEYEADLHRQCDFVMANFGIRQKARLQEMEAIAKAKAILSGSAAE